MGLTLVAKNIKGEELDSVEIGYRGFMLFRNALLSFVSNGRFNSLNLDKYDPINRKFDEKQSLLSWCWFNKLGIVLESKTFINKQLLQKNSDQYKNIKFYLAKLNHMKKHYPKLFDVYPFIVHTDVSGEIPYRQLVKLLPAIKEFYCVDKSNYGYVNYDYNFTECFIEVLEEAINNKGKIIFQ